MQQTPTISLLLSAARPWAAVRSAVLGLGFLALAGLTVGSAHAQTGSDFPPVRLGLADTSPNTGNSLDHIGIPYERVFHDPPFSEQAAPYQNLIDFPSLGIDPVAKFGNRGRIALEGLRLDTDVNLNTPFKAGYAPEDAKLKLGPVFINWSRITATLLVTDNENQTVHDRRSGAISIVSQDFDIRLQLSEGMYANIKGSLVYLPFRNAIGLSGFGTNDPFMFTARASVPPTRLSISDELTVGGWDLDLYAYAQGDQLSMDQRYRFENGANLWNDREFNERDVAGTYSFGSTLGGVSNQFNNVDGIEDINRYDNNDWEIGTFVRAFRDLPLGSSQHLGITATRQDTIRKGLDSRIHQTTTETYNLQYTDERIQTRFKPFALYTLSRSYDDQAPDDDRHTWDHTLRAGITGPVTENMSLYADFGYSFNSYDFDYMDHTHSEVYRVGIMHDINPYMAHSLSLERSVGSNFTVDDTINYNHRFIIGPHLTAIYFYEEGYSHNRFVDRQTAWFRRNGGNIYYEVGPRLMLHASGVHERQRRDPATNATEKWRFEVGADYRLEGTKTTINIMAIHKEEKKDATGVVIEDLMVLTITREI